MSSLRRSLHVLVALCALAFALPAEANRAVAKAWKKPSFLTIARDGARGGLAKQLAGWVGKTPHLDALPEIAISPGRRLGGGIEKKVHLVDRADGLDAKNIVQLRPRWWGGPRILEYEVAAMSAARKLGLPVVRVFGKNTRQTILGPRVSILEEKLVGSDRDYTRLSPGPERDEKLRASPLNARTVRDAKRIKRLIVNKQIAIGDMQFLIGSDGAVYLNDIQTPRVGVPPTEQQFEAINSLIGAAREAMELRQ